MKIEHEKNEKKSFNFRKNAGFTSSSLQQFGHSQQLFKVSDILHGPLLSKQFGCVKLLQMLHSIIGSSSFVFTSLQTAQRADVGSVGYKMNIWLTIIGIAFIHLESYK